MISIDMHLTGDCLRSVKLFQTQRGPHDLIITDTEGSQVSLFTDLEQIEHIGVECLRYVAEMRKRRAA